MIDKKPCDDEPSDLKLNVNDCLSGYVFEETLPEADAQFDQQAMEAFLRFLETEFVEPIEVLYPDEPEDVLDEPSNGWPGYPFL